MDVLHRNPEAPQEGLDSRQGHHPRYDDGHGHQAPDHAPHVLDAQLRSDHSDRYGRDEDTVQDRSDSGSSMIDSHGTHDR
jgi:hypothetical protein